MNALIVGMGGLGCPAALALARAGVKRLTLADPDRVDVTNLHRQFLYTDADVGRLKVDVAAERLRREHPALEVQTLAERINPHPPPRSGQPATGSPAEPLIRAHDVVLDATDGISTKFALNDACVRAGVPLVHGGALRLSGQAMRVEPGGPCLRCVFEEAQLAGEQTCAQAGVLGSITAVVGSLQAMLALRSDLSGALFVVEGSRLSVRKVPVRKASDCDVCAR